MLHEIMKLSSRDKMLPTAANQVIFECKCTWDSSFPGEAIYGSYLHLTRLPAQSDVLLSFPALRYKGR
jgi:hypothetical protein